MWSASVGHRFNVEVNIKTNCQVFKQSLLVVPCTIYKTATICSDIHTHINVPSIFIHGHFHFPIHIQLHSHIHTCVHIPMIVAHEDISGTDMHMNMDMDMDMDV